MQSYVWILDAWFAGTSWSANLKGTGWAVEAWAEGRSWGTRKWEVKTSGHIWALILKFANSPGLWAFPTVRNLPTSTKPNHLQMLRITCAHRDRLLQLRRDTGAAVPSRATVATPRGYGGVANALHASRSTQSSSKERWRWSWILISFLLKQFTMLLQGTNWDYWSLITCFIIFPWFLFTNLADFALFRKLCGYFL